MTDYGLRHRDIGSITADKAIARVQFTPSPRFAQALSRFSIGDSPVRLYTSRRVELDYHGTDYTPDSRRQLSRMEDAVIPIANRQIKLASHVLLRILSSGALGLDFKLMPSEDVLRRLGDFARDPEGTRTDHVDVHAIIPVQNRIHDGVGFNLAANRLEELLMIRDPSLHPPDSILEVPRGRQVSVFDARVVSRNAMRRHLH